MGEVRESKRKGDAEAPSCLRFCSLLPDCTVRVLWVDSESKEGNEAEFARLDTGCFYTQQTYVGHLWRLRDAATGALLAEYAGPSATVTLLASGGLRVQPGLVRPPPADISDPRWGAYRLRGAACGIPILAYDCVCQEAVEAAEGVIGCMLEGAPAEVAAALEEAAAEVAIIGRDQVTTDLPMYRHLRGVDCGNDGGDYDSATRGLGGNPGNPTTSCGEENLLMLAGDRYPRENILVHEFGHAVMDLGLLGSPLQEEIVAAYEAAAASGAYDSSCYMMANASEYWAEGTQAWFDATVREDVTSGINTREKLKRRDPPLAALLAAVYGDGEWRYPATAPHPFPPEPASPSKRQRTEGGAAAAAGAQQGAPLVQVVVENPLPLEVGGDSMAQPLLRRGGRRQTGSLSRRGGGGGQGVRGPLASIRRRFRRGLARALRTCFSFVCGLTPPADKPS